MLPEQNWASAAYSKYSSRHIPSFLINLHLVKIARIIKEWGVKGEFKTLPLLNNFELIKPGTKVYLLDSKKNSEARTISSVKKNNAFVIISVAGIESPEAASKYRGADILAEKKLLPSLVEDEYYYDQIIGLSVITHDGSVIGKVIDIFETGSNDVYIVKGEAQEYLIPAIRDVIASIDTDKGFIMINKMDGLLD